MRFRIQTAKHRGSFFVKITHYIRLIPIPWADSYPPNPGSLPYLSNPESDLPFPNLFGLGFRLRLRLGSSVGRAED